jgi:FHA domain-containing protein
VAAAPEQTLVIAAAALVPVAETAQQPAATPAPSAPPTAAPSVPAATAGAATAAAASAPSAAPASTDELLRALLKGAGLRDVEIPGGLTPELMRKLGELTNEATRGLLDMLEARASAKRNVRADMTVIVATDNNPLKFSPNLEAALTHLFVPKGRGFMPPLRALADVYEDLRTHQVGFMAGMRAALAVVLARFDPHELERRSGEPSLADSFLPGNRKAKLWDQFTQLYGQVSSEAESDFHTLFGAEFLKTYRAHAVKAPAAADSPAQR